MKNICNNKLLKLQYEKLITIVNQEINVDCEVFFSKCISVRNCIKYSTKEDHECMFKNIDDKNFHLNYHIYYWSLENENFTILDPFVQENIRYANHIEHKFREFKSATIPQYPYFRIKINKRFSNWRDSVVDWYNDFLAKKISLSLYLYGDSQTGKTSFILSVFGNIIFYRSN